MSPTLEATNGGAGIDYGVHKWSDQHGNQGTEVLSERHIHVRATRVNGLFDPSTGNEKTTGGLTSYFNDGVKSKRKIFVVVDTGLSQSKRSYIEDYFSWCKTEKLLEDFMLIPFTASKTDKTLDQVATVITSAKRLGMRRRDLFVAIGATAVTDIVGFAAAIYRRAAPYLLVPTDLIGIIYCHDGGKRLTLNHVSHNEETHRGMFALSHPPIASFYDPGLLDSLDRSEIRRGLVEIIRLSVSQDDVLFSYVEAYSEKILTGTEGGEYLITAIELAARGKNSNHLSTAKFGDEAVRAVEQIKGINYDDADAVAIGISLMSALSFLRGNLSNADLGRVLNLLEKSGLAIFDAELEADALWEHMVATIQERGDSAFIIPKAVGEEGFLFDTDLSPEDIRTALNVLRNYCRVPDLEMITRMSELPDISGGVYERTHSENVQYHVAAVRDVFSVHNTTLIHNYCGINRDGRGKKILVVVDDYSDNAIGDIVRYFESHSSAMAGVSILSMHVSGKNKDIDSVLKVVDAAIDLGMSPQDLFVVVGGGTLMDVVGFAAAMFKGGTPYMRIPTTLVGLIDAGVGVKVGVNFGDHKNFIGRYYAPVACLNDPDTFLVTLPQREFACGLAEAIKMALIKSPRLFEVIERHHCEVEFNTYTHEVIDISIRTMLEELQPNLEEQSLCRLVDFGHEFGHIIEARAHHEVRPIFSDASTFIDLAIGYIKT